MIPDHWLKVTENKIKCVSVGWTGLIVPFWIVLHIHRNENFNLYKSGKTFLFLNIKCSANIIHKMIGYEFCLKNSWGINTQSS